jgi:peptidoglycan-associated lipoprotein
MRLKKVSMIAAIMLLAACAQDAKDGGNNSGDGRVQPVNQPQTAAAPANPVAARPEPGSKEEFVAEVGDRVFFGFDKSDLSSDAQATLDRQAAWLKKYPSARVTVEGHCDERGTREYNLALGERRSAAVRDYLVARGVDESRVETISFGKERPVAFGNDEAAWSQNRRGVTVIN